jgi:competence protein ComEC
MGDLPQPQISKHPLLIIAVALSVGIVIGKYHTGAKSAAAIASTLVIALFTAFVWKRVKAIAVAGVLVAFMFSGYVLMLLSAGNMASDRIGRLYELGQLSSNEPVEVTGFVQGEPERAPGGFYLTVRSTRLRMSGVERKVSGDIVLWAGDSDPVMKADYEKLQLHHGAGLRVLVILKRDDNYRNPGMVPFTEYLARRGYDAAAVIKSPLLVERLDDETVFLPLAWLYQWRGSLGRDFFRTFSPETAGILAAALLGNQYNISHSAAERFRAGGTFHVLVISGLQIAFIGTLMMMAVRSFTRRRFLQFLIACSFIWAFTIAVGADASVARSALMFTTVALAPLLSRRANTLNGLGGAALILLVWDPQNVFDPSFQLTFLSVLAIVTMAVPLISTMQRVGSWRPTQETPYPPACPLFFRVISEWLFWSERKWRMEMAGSNIRYRLFKSRWAAVLERTHLQGVIRFAVSAIVVSASVQLGMIPLLIIYFHRLSLASLVLNIFVGVLMAALSFVAVTATILAHVSATVSGPFVLIAEKIEWAMVHAVDPFNRLGIDSVRLPSYSGWMALSYLIYFGLLALLVLQLARWNPLRPAWLSRGKMLSGRRELRAVVVLFALSLALIIFHPFSAGRADGNLRVDFIDVGQGDSALLTLPDGTTLLIDGGGRPDIDWDQTKELTGDEPFERDTRSVGEKVVSEFLWSRGLDRVDYIVPTHADADHIDGLNDVARNFSVRAAIVARTPARDPEYRRFVETMSSETVPVVQIGAGDSLRFGDVTADVLWPPPRADAEAPWRNNDGVVLRIRFGERVFLFAADIEKQAEAELLQQSLNLQSDIVKVAHHGSRTSSTDPFVNSTRPSRAIISVGRTSIFGHPHPEVVTRWRTSGAEVMTTGENGTITAVTNGHDLKVSTFVK